MLKRGEPSDDTPNRVDFSFSGKERGMAGARDGTCGLLHSRTRTHRAGIGRPPYRRHATRVGERDIYARKRPVGFSDDGREGFFHAVDVHIGRWCSARHPSCHAFALDCGHTHARYTRGGDVCCPPGIVCVKIPRPRDD